MTDRKVAIQLISTGGVYGAERALLELAGYLSEQGWQSHVVALEGNGARELVERAAAEGIGGEAFVPTGRLGLLPMISKLRRLLRRYPGAIVHAHGYKADILLSWLGAARRHPRVSTCHNWVSDTRKLRLLEVLDKRSLRRFDRVVAVSGIIARELLASGVPAHKVSVIDNGISVPQADEAARVAVRAELGLAGDERLIVHLGRLARSKRIDLLLEAIAALPEAFRTHVLLAGEGEQGELLGTVARSLGLEQRVHFGGYRSDVGRLLAAADLMALSSEREGLPIVILEAMAMRCPIVATRVGAIANVLTDGEDAWIVPANDCAALRGALCEALARPELARARAQRAYTKYLRLYSRTSMGERYLQVYDDARACRRGLQRAGTSAIHSS
jgi:glycosyltransferase involved in cell wall biosynthesis